MLWRASPGGNQDRNLARYEKHSGRPSTTPFAFVFRHTAADANDHLTGKQESRQEVSIDPVKP